MQYRKFGRLEWRVSALGFGCMRLPIVGGDSSRIDEPEAIKMLHYAIDHGVNYLDTAYPYHGGNSERLVGKALRGGYRDRVRVATKLPPWRVEEPADFDRILNEQLAKLETDHIDFYLLHSLNMANWTKVRDMGVLDWAEGAIRDGRIRYLGFSFHDEFKVFKEIVDAYDWTFCQIQYNYMDIKRQAGTRGLKYAASKGMAVVVMEPLLGGRLVNPPEPVRELWDSAPVRRTPVEWALMWLWNQPEVSLVLSGMSTMQQVVENVAIADRSGVGVLSEEELALVERVRARYQELSPVPCTQCRYCMPCPNGVDIPRNFAVFNTGVMYNILDQMRRSYERMDVEIRASACVQCRECEPKCPQQIKISEWMPVVHSILGEGAALDPSLFPQ